MRIAIVVCLAGVIGCTDHHGSSSETRYLAFQVDVSAQPVATWVERIVEATGGATGDGKAQQLAYVIDGLTLDVSDDEMRARIDAAFVAGEQRGVAVGFHVDDSMEW